MSCMGRRKDTAIMKGNRFNSVEARQEANRPASSGRKGTCLPSAHAGGLAQLPSWPCAQP